MEDRPFGPVGVSLAAIKQLHESIGGTSATVGMTTSDVSGKYVMPATADRRCAYVDLFPASDAALVGPATVFVSHAWAMPFNALVEALAEADMGMRTRDPTCTPFFYLDVITRSQFNHSAMPFQWWTTTFRKGIGRIGHTIIVLEWGNPGPFGRLWCVYEMFCTVAEGGTVEIAMPPSSAESFRKELLSDFPSIAGKLSSINLEQAQCFLPGDQDNISTAIKTTVGFDRVTNAVVGAMRDWMVRIARNNLAAIADRAERITSPLQLNLGRLLAESGELSEAVMLLRETAKARHQRLGGEHSETTIASSTLAGVLMAQGNFDEAEPLLRGVIDAQRKILGDEHPDTLDSKSTLGWLLQNRGDLESAEPLIRESLVALRSTLGDLHPSTLASINNLGMLLQARGDLDSAEPLLREALAAFQRIFGDAHPSTLASISSLGQLLQCRGDLAGAEPLLRKALSGVRRTLGDTHPSAVASMGNLGHLLQAQGNFDGAEPLLRRALEACRINLGDCHPSTLVAISNLGELQQARGNLDGAESLFREELAKLRRTLGNAHPTTCKCISRLGRLLAERGLLSEAKLLLQEALTVQQNILGAGHTESLRTMGDLLYALERYGRDRPAEAELRAKLDDLLAEQASADLVLGRFRFSRFEPLHVSQTSIVIEGTDERDPRNKRPVALKFLRDRAQFVSEVEARRRLGDDSSAVVGFVRDGVFAPESFSIVDRERINRRFSLIDSGRAVDKRFTASSTFLLVMPLCSKSLLTVIDTESATQEDWANRAHAAFKQTTEALKQLHDLGLIHGDIKPRNVLRVRPERQALFVLIDLDAARHCDGAEAGFVGPKLSTGYAPPEALSARHEAAQAPGKVEAVQGGCASCGTAPPLQWCGREAGGRTLRADRSWDMWGLGCMLFFMLVGRPLFPVDKHDNLAEENALDTALKSRLFRWSKDRLREKLGFIPGYALSRGAGDLLEKLLCASPLERLTAAGVLKHPYVTGYRYDVFISYRRFSELDLARSLHKKLTDRKLAVFLDEREIPLGGNFREEFCGSIALTRVFVPLLSRAAIDVQLGSPAGAPRPPAGPWCELTKASVPIDNVLLEHRVAFELMGRGRSHNASTGGAAAAFAGPPARLQNVCPVFVGPLDHASAAAELASGARDVSVKRLSYWKTAPRPPPEGVVVEAIELEMREILTCLGLAPSSAAAAAALPPCTAADVWRCLSALANGKELSDEGGIDEDALVGAIIGAVDRTRLHSGAGPISAGGSALSGACSVCGRGAAGAALAPIVEVPAVGPIHAARLVPIVGAIPAGRVNRSWWRWARNTMGL
jgi:serine/threonine protein kinase/Flp pilus assembly protein TadD